LTNTEPVSAELAVEVAHPWDAALPELRRRWPKPSEGVLFCVWKLQQDSASTLRDFRDEARLRGITLGGRSLHSAKILLGLEQPSPPRRLRPEPGAPAPRGQAGSLEDQLIDNVKRIQEAAAADAQRLKRAMREAVRILTEALGR